MRVHLEYGRTGLEVELPDRNVVKCFGTGRRAVGRSAMPRCGRAWPGRPALRRWPNWPADAAMRAWSFATSPAPCPTGASAADAGDPGSGAASPASEILILVATGLHRPEPGRRNDRDGRPLRWPRIIASRTITAATARRAHVAWARAPRRARLDRLAVRRGRAEDHHGPDRAALHGRLFRRAETDLPGPGRPGNGAGSGTARTSSNTPTPATAAWTATRSTKRTRPSPAWPAAISSSTW